MEQDKPYLQSDINLFQLAEHLNISTHDLSFLLNTGFPSISMIISIIIESMKLKGF
jgi:hypothetical protein